MLRSGTGRALTAGLCALVLASTAEAQLLTSTGLLSAGGLDSRWQISTNSGSTWTAASIVTSVPGPWVTVPGGSWVSAASNGSGGGGNYRIRQQFTLGSGDALSFVLRCTVDNTFVGLYVGGSLFSNSACSQISSFGAPLTFTAANFATGLNTLEIRFTGDNTTDGAAVAISDLSYTPGSINTSTVPEPATSALCAAGLLALVALRRRRRA